MRNLARLNYTEKASGGVWGDVSARVHPPKSPSLRLFVNIIRIMSLIEHYWKFFLSFSVQTPIVIITSQSQRVFASFAHTNSLSLSFSPSGFTLCWHAPRPTRGCCFAFSFGLKGRESSMAHMHVIEKIKATRQAAVCARIQTLHRGKASAVREMERHINTREKNATPELHVR